MHPIILIANTKESEIASNFEKFKNDINSKKQVIQFNFNEEKNECYKKFFVNACLDKAKLSYYNKMQSIQEQEIYLFDLQKSIKSTLRDRNIRQKINKLNQKNDVRSKKNIEKRKKKIWLQRKKTEKKILNEKSKKTKKFLFSF